MKKRIAIWVLLVLLLAGGVALCVVRWDAWFTNPAEPMYDVPDGPSNVVLTYGQEAHSSRVISWRGGQDSLAVSRLLLTRPDGLSDTIAAARTYVETRSGEAVFCRVDLNRLTPGRYAYQAETAGRLSDIYTFMVGEHEADTLLLFGDLQYTDVEEATRFFDLAAATVPQAMAYAYIGDIIERPTDEYWQLFFTSIGDRVACLPQVATLGNHEYLKGIHKQYDVRWPHIFVNPDNGPQRFLGRSYYINFPAFRLIVLDTDGLQNVSDHLVLRTWLTQVLRYETTGWNETQRTNDRWNIVLMHHPIYSAGMGRDNPTIAAALRSALLEADLVVAGHDHNYARHRHHHTTTPAFVITSSSAKSYLPKCSTIEERLGSNHAFFSSLVITPDTMRMLTYMVDTTDVPLVYDDLTFVRTEEGVEVLEGDSLMAERLELPKRYEGRNNVRIRRFLNRRKTRLE